LLEFDSVVLSLPDCFVLVFIQIVTSYRIGVEDAGFEASMEIRNVFVVFLILL